MKYLLRDGTETDAATWASKQADAAYVQVVKTHISDGRWISTIWVGIAPTPFETVVFDDAEQRGIDRAHYDSEDAARRGHDAFVAKWSEGG